MNAPPDTAPTPSLRQQAVGGARWTAVSATAALVTQFAQFAILGRLLAPADFGILTMIVVVIGLLNMIADLGVTNQIVRDRSLTPRQFHALVTRILLLALLLAAMLVPMAPVCAAYYKTPLLTRLIPAMAPYIVVTALTQPYAALLQRELRFRALALTEIGGYLAGAAVAVTLAWHGHGARALLGGILALASAKFLATVACAARIHPLRLAWRAPALGPALRFGGFQMSERLLHYAGANLDKFILGGTLGAASLGLYGMAYQLVMKPPALLNPIFTRVTLPLFARIHDDDARLGRGYLHTLQLIAGLAAPIYLVLFVASGSILRLLLGPQWAAAAHLLSALAVLGFLFVLGNPIGSLLLAKGRADLGFYYNVVGVIVYAAFIAVGSRFDAIGVAIAFVLAAGAVMLPLEFPLRRRLTGLTAGAYIRAIFPLLAVIALPAAAGKLLAIRLVPSLGLFAGEAAATAATLAGFAALLLATHRPLLRELLNLLRAA